MYNSRFTPNLIRFALHCEMAIPWLLGFSAGLETAVTLTLAGLNVLVGNLCCNTASVIGRMRILIKWALIAVMVIACEFAITVSWVTQSDGDTVFDRLRAQYTAKFLGGLLLLILALRLSVLLLGTLADKLTARHGPTTKAK